ncbi:VRR-NUC domain-containing protein [Haloactinopolyspora alba]|uniref:VRR-NUC domain-containing protein n=1 Tax=Haloactinopolyspora alba TaxID=648780 RepID=A0A2P8DF34_9ACTN|nr:VRR-NUC domain-containing protein [Haloactinopolyspora alba]PSK95812.1 VRR-NUC domain-containing protein [Haloactinopolyspora alba]
MSRRLTPTEKRLRTIRESQWQTLVENIAQAYGWMRYHAPDNTPRTAASGRRYVQNVKAGWPDLALLHPRRGLFMVAELKTETGQVSDDQAEWLAGFRAAGIRAEIWRPRDEDTVKAVLGPQALGWENWPTRDDPIEAP